MTPRAVPCPEISVSKPCLPRRASRARFCGESSERIVTLAPGAIANLSSARVTVRIPPREKRIWPLSRLQNLQRTLIVALMSPEHSPPPPAQVRGERDPRPVHGHRSTQGDAGEDGAIGSVEAAGEPGASACAHSLTQAEITSTRVNTEGNAVEQLL